MLASMGGLIFSQALRTVGLVPLSMRRIARLGYCNIMKTSETSPNVNLEGIIRKFFLEGGQM